METHTGRHKREDRKAALIDRLVEKYSIEVVRPDDVTVLRFAEKAHIHRMRAKEILEQLADSSELVRVTVKNVNGRVFTAYREK